MTTVKGRRGFGGLLSGGAYGSIAEVSLSVFNNSLLITLLNSGISVDESDELGRIGENALAVCYNVRSASVVLCLTVIRFSAGLSLKVALKV
jgi:hypothetical protein